MKIIKLLLLLLLVFAIDATGTAAEQKEPAANKTNANSVVLAYAEEIKFVPFPADLKNTRFIHGIFLKLPEFREPYFRILAGRTDIKWLKTLSGPSELNKLVSTQPGTFVVIESCKQHWCGSHNIVIFFDPARRKCWALLKEDKQTSWLGDPNNELKELFGKSL